MEKEISLWKWLEEKQKKALNGVIKFAPLNNSTDKLFCELYEKFETQKWQLRFSDEIRNNRSDDEVITEQQKLYKEFKLHLENTIVKFTPES